MRNISTKFLYERSLTELYVLKRKILEKGPEQNELLRDMIDMMIENLTRVRRIDSLKSTQPIQPNLTEAGREKMFRDKVAFNNFIHNNPQETEFIYTPDPSTQARTSDPQPEETHEESTSENEEADPIVLLDPLKVIYKTPENEEAQTLEVSRLIKNTSELIQKVLIALKSSTNCLDKAAIGEVQKVLKLKLEEERAFDTKKGDGPSQKDVNKRSHTKSQSEV